MEIVFNLVAYGVPIVALPLVLRRNSSVRRIVLLVFLAAPLIGELTYLLSLRDQAIGALLTLRFWKTLVAFYPMALFPLGVWGALFGAVGTLLLGASASRFGLRLPGMLITGGVVGAMVGFVFSVLFVWTAVLSGASSQPTEGFLPYALAGAAAGAICGLSSALFLGTGSHR